MFPRHSRFKQIDVLGQGGMGIVYRVLDALTDREVALKTLRNPTRDEIYYLKREFRTLSESTHPNLVEFYELFVSNTDAFFTMELIDGGEIIDAIRRDLSPGQAPAAEILLSSISELVEGVDALHSAGIIHRDLKASNVMTRASGSLVILDFGLIAEARPGPLALSRSEHAAGTILYMAPEILSGRKASLSSDYYALGVLLYALVTGLDPFVGGMVDQLDAKRAGHCRLPSTVAKGAPPELDELITSLLAPEPNDRPNAEDIRRAISRSGSVGPPRRVVDRALVGRETAVDALTSALAAAEEGLVIRAIEGVSGVGKSTLVESFLAQSATSAHTLVLRSRCRLYETIAYQALDGLIDDLSRFLVSRPVAEREAYLEGVAPALIRTFPVLGRALPATPEHVIGDEDFEVRAMAADGLATLLGRIAAHHRIVMWIDDAQWADRDSLAMLRRVFSAAARPRGLLLVSHRAEEGEQAAFVAGLRELAGVDDDVFRIRLDMLSDDACRALIRQLVGPEVSAAVADHILRESTGHPYFVEELARASVASEVSDDWLAGDLRALVAARVEALSEEERRIVEVVALCPRPTPQAVVLAAAGMERERSPLIGGLVKHCLLRWVVTRGATAVDVYHDRISECVSANLAPEVATKHHLALAEALAPTGPEAERLLHHYREGNAVELALAAALEAARSSFQKLAFDHAATLFEAALSLGPGPLDERGGLLKELGHALAQTGRLSDAAARFLEARDLTDGDERSDLERLAAENLLHSGDIARGFVLARDVLKAHGIRLSMGTRGAIFSLVAMRMRVRLRGFAYRRRDEARVPRADIRRIDACHAVAAGLANVDAPRGAYLQTYNLLLALDAGEPRRICRALALEAGYGASGRGGKLRRRRVRRLLREADLIAEGLRDEHLAGFVQVMRGVVAWNEGRWSACHRKTSAAIDAFKTLKRGVTWENDFARLYNLDALAWLGRWGDLARTLPDVIADASSRGNLQVETITRLAHGTLIGLVQGRPEVARDELRIMDRWTRFSPFEFEDYVAMYNAIEIAMYDGDGEAARRVVEANEAPLDNSLLLEIPSIAVQMANLRARANVAAAATCSSSRRTNLLAAATRDATRLRRAKAAWSRPLGELADAAVAHARGDLSSCSELLLRAGLSADAADMAPQAWAARRARGRIIGGDEGAKMIAAVDEAMAREGVVDPARLCQVYLPIALG